MMKETEFTKLLAKRKQTPEYQCEEILLDITEQICEIMEKKRISRAELARRLGKKRPYITSLLNGKRNTTIETLVRIAHALDEKLEVIFSSSTCHMSTGSIKAKKTKSEEKLSLECNKIVSDLLIKDFVELKNTSNNRKNYKDFYDKSSQNQPKEKKKNDIYYELTALQTFKA
jgi:transcriptional regulator with XRE-family HTH domain